MRERATADAAKTVDADFDGHGSGSFGSGGLACYRPRACPQGPEALSGARIVDVSVKVQDVSDEARDIVRPLASTRGMR